MTTTSVPDAMSAVHPTLDAYPMATVPVMPVYNLPTATVGLAQLVLTNQAMCRIWRGNITHWSVAHMNNKNNHLNQQE